MAVAACDRCGSVNLYVVAQAPNGHKRIRCTECSHRWATGAGRGRNGRGPAGAKAPAFFPSMLELSDEEAGERFAVLVEAWRRERRGPSEEELGWRTAYQGHFASDELRSTSPEVFHAFANSPHVANAGNMSVFNRGWTAMGDEPAAKAMADAIEYLLHATEPVELEDRLTNLIAGRNGFGMRGLKESLLTKVLCIAHADRFVPILKVDGPAGKIQFAQHIFGIPKAVPAGASVGASIVWANDQLVERLRPAFPDLLEAGYFLWWAQGQR